MRGGCHDDDDDDGGGGDGDDMMIKTLHRWILAFHTIT